MLTDADKRVNAEAGEAYEPCCIINGHSMRTLALFNNSNFELFERASHSLRRHSC